MLAKHLALVVAAFLPFIVQGCSSGAGQSYFSSAGAGAASGDSPLQTSGEAGDAAASAGAAASGGGEAGAGAAASLNDAGAAGTKAALNADDALIVPQDVAVMPLQGENDILHMFALTLRQGASNIELYAALRNDGIIPACDAAVSVELYDKAQQSLAAAVSAALTTHLYRRTDGSGAIASCVAPGDVSMVAITDLPANVALDEVGYVVYQCPFFALDALATDGFALEKVTSVMSGAGTAYAGSFVNELDVAVKNPAVALFPVNRVGRPLGVVRAKSAITLAPGDAWAFETTQAAEDEMPQSGTDALSNDYFAYPSAALAN